MTAHLMFAQGILGGFGFAALAIIGILLVVFFFAAVWASRYTKVGPNEVLVVSGRKYRVMNPDGTRA